MYWTPARRTRAFLCSGLWARMWSGKSSAPGALTQPETVPWSWCRRMRTCAYAQTWTRYSGPAGESFWSRHGQGEDCGTAISGAGQRTSREHSLCWTRSTAGMDTAGSIPYTRCSVGTVRQPTRPKSYWSTIQTHKKTGASTCLCWSSLSERTRRTTGICIIWAGSICITADGTPA